MALKPQEQFKFGGVSANSSAVAMPAERCILLRNWRLTEDGHLELRPGVTFVVSSPGYSNPSDDLPGIDPSTYVE